MGISLPVGPVVAADTERLRTKNGLAYNILCSKVIEVRPTGSLVCTEVIFPDLRQTAEIGAGIGVQECAVT